MLSDFKLFVVKILIRTDKIGSKTEADVVLSVEKM